MTKQDILEHFKDINAMYNECTRYDDLSRMLDELQEPCDDAISRQAVAEVLLKYAHSAEGKAFAEFLISQINDLPPVTPQYTDAEIQKMQDLEFAEIQKAYEIGKAENPNRWGSVIEDIKSEINELSELDHIEPTYEDCKRDVLEILDKYKASPTGAERSDKE